MVVDGVSDWFSAQVNLPSGTSFHKARVIVEGGWIHAFAASADRSPALAASAELTGDPVKVGGRRYLPTADGNWEVYGPCGCSSPSKVWASTRLLEMIRRS